MLRKKIITIVALIAGLSPALNAQQAAQYSQYMYTTQLFNPAYVGTQKNTELNFVHRSQWVGVEGAPNTTTVAINAPLKRGLGIGGSLMQDGIGAVTETTAKIDIAYRILISRNIKLSFGLTGGLSSLNFNLRELNIYDGNEISQTSMPRTVAPNVGFGTYLYGKRFFIGISSPNLLTTQTELSSAKPLSVKRQMHGYLMAGYVAEDKSNRFKVKSAFLMRYADGAPLAMNLSSTISFKGGFEAGLGYQWRSGIQVLAGLNIKRRWFVGYTFDWSTTPLRNSNFGSHEVILRVKLGDLRDINRWTSERFF